MVKAVTRWGWVKPLAKSEKALIGARCDAFIAGTLVPRFLPEIRQTQFNYPIALHGRWRGSSYSFFIRYRSGFPENAGEEFDSAWARLDHDDEALTSTRFHLMWMRHTGKWYGYYRSATLEEAFAMIEHDPVVQPHT